MALGRKTGGRKKGTPNKANAARAALLSQALDGEDPLLFFADVLRNKEAPLELRFAAAKELAPYRHPRLSSTEANVNANVTYADLLDMVAKEEAKAKGCAQEAAVDLQAAVAMARG